MTWSMSTPTGPGAAQYTLSASPAPGLLIPGATSTVTVSAAAMPSPAPNPSPSAYAALVTITTDVPLDPPHVVSLGQTPIGDQVSWSAVSPLRFGQVPVPTPLTQAFTITNSANFGSPLAKFSLGIAGPGASAYAIVPQAISGLGGGGLSIPATLRFSPTDAIAYPATLRMATSDPVCTPLPNGIELSGTGTAGKVMLSATTLAFGTDPGDAAGLVNCGAKGPPQSLVVTNAGNQAFHIAGLSLGLGASSPYTLSGDGATSGANVPIGGSVSLTVTPGAIPQAVANPGDPSPFTDTLTVTTDAAGDAPHVVHLVMQARGAVIADTPLATAWTFGAVSLGSMATFTSTIRNTGNAGVTVGLAGVASPSIFTLANNPTKAPGGGVVTPLVGEFVPSASNTSWSARGTLVVTPDQVLCEPLPAQWNSPTIDLSGSSNSQSAITVSGSLAFPDTDCGSAAPAGRSVTLTNDTNDAYAYSLSFGSGQYYASSPPPGPGTTGTLPADHAATIVVTPNTITPGPGVAAGSAPYADELLITVATSPPTQLTVPISWTLRGAVLSLPQGAGPRTDALGAAYYPVDSTSGFALPMANGGTDTASVTFAVAPPGAFTLSPQPPIAVIPGIGAGPQMSSAAGDAACPSLTTGTVTFFYAGPVCQPFALPRVTVEGCVGTM